MRVQRRATTGSGRGKKSQTKPITIFTRFKLNSIVKMEATLTSSCKDPNLNACRLIMQNDQHLFNQISLNSTEASSQNWPANAEFRPLTKLVLNHLLEPLARIDTTLDYYLTDAWVSAADERSSKLPLMTGGPWKLLAATLIYLYLIKRLLPRLMRPLPAFELNWLIRAYNLLMVASNVYAFYHGARILNWGFSCFGCERIDHQDYSPKALELLHYGWLF